MGTLVSFINTLPMLARIKLIAWVKAASVYDMPDTAYGLLSVLRAGVTEDDLSTLKRQTGIDFNASSLRKLYGSSELLAVGADDAAIALICKEANGRPWYQEYSVSTHYHDVLKGKTLKIVVTVHPGWEDYDYKLVA